MPVSIFTNRLRQSQGQRTWPGPSGGTVKPSCCILSEPSIPQMKIINILIPPAPLSHCGVETKLQNQTLNIHTIKAKPHNLKLRSIKTKSRNMQLLNTKRHLKLWQVIS